MRSLSGKRGAVNFPPFIGGGKLEAGRTAKVDIEERIDLIRRSADGPPNGPKLRKKDEGRQRRGANTWMHSKNGLNIPRNISNVQGLVKRSQCELSLMTPSW